MPDVKYYPFLLDRLTVDKEARAGGLSPTQLRASLLRDLSNLLNTRAPTEWADGEEFPQMITSVLNYGIPDLSGATATSISTHALERSILKAIQIFEPRLERHSLSVKITVSQDAADYNVLVMEIKGQMMAAHLKEPLYVKTRLNVESGQITLGDRNG